jgi:hypothetical protein
MGDGVSGSFVPLLAKYAPMPAILKPPVRWGSEQGIQELLGHEASAIQFERKQFVMHFRSIDHLVQLYRTNFGPTIRTMKFLAEEKKRALHEEMSAFFKANNIATDGTLAFRCDYAEILVTRR